MCGEIASVCLTRQADVNEENLEKWDEVVIDAALLQVSAVRQVNVRFGKKVKDYPTPQNYRKARREFFKQHVNELSEFLKTHASELTGRINELGKEQ